MRLLALDPGTEQSAYVIYDTDTGELVKWALVENDFLLHGLDTVECEQMAYEMVASYGMAVGREVFETVLWVGRFIERWLCDPGSRVRSIPNVIRPAPLRIFRREVKAHVCHDSKAADKNIRRALIDRYGDTERQAIGLKANPGPLYGLAKDGWSALAIAITAAEAKLQLPAPSMVPAAIAV